MVYLSYIRFKGTYNELIECYEHMEDDTSEREEEYKNKLIRLCRKIVDNYEEI